MRTVGSLPTPWDADPYLVGERADDELHAHACDDEACVLVLDGHPGRSLVGIGRPEAVARLLTQSAAAFAALGPRTLTLERGTWEQVSADVREVFVGAHRSKRVTLGLDRSSFGVYDEAGSRWKTVPGKYRIYVGTSSRDLPLSASVRVR